MGEGVLALTVQVSVRQTEYTSRGMSYRYKIMLHLVHVSYNNRIAIFGSIITLLGVHTV